MQLEYLKKIFEAVLMTAQQPLSLAKLLQVFAGGERPEIETARQALDELGKDYVDRAVELKKLAGGYSFQAKLQYSQWIAKLQQERAPRYSRALLETLAIIAYRQPVTRAEIEDIRGVSTSANTVKILLDRQWISRVGQRDVPGKPGIYATTKQFLDDFNLANLKDLPKISDQLELPLS